MNPKPVGLKKFSLFHILIITALAIGLYSNTLRNGFVYDDEFTIVNNTLVKSFDNLPLLFDKAAYFSRSGELSYRPLVTLTYFLDYTLYGLKPWGYHLTNILLHTINGVLVYIFLILIHQCQKAKGRAGFQTLIISLLFVSHPILTEAVNAISFREELLVFLFYLATMNIYLWLRTNTISPRSSVFIYTISCLTFILALLSKEMAATLPVIIICFDSIFSDEKKKLMLFNPYNIGFMLIAIAYLYLRFHYFYNPVEGHMLHWLLEERLLTFPWLLLNYIKLVLFPVSLSADYVVVPIKSLFPPLLIASAGFILALIVFKTIRVEKDTAFGIFLFIITLIPVYNIIPINDPFSERYLYLPAFGFAIIMGSYICRRIDRNTIYKSLYMVIFLLIVSFYCLGVTNRNKTWKDGYSLWSDTTKKMPNSSRAHNGLGVLLADKGDLDGAEFHFRTALRYKPDDLKAYSNLKQVYEVRKLSEKLKQH